MENIIQVAGIIDKQEAELLIKSGINYLGFPLRLPINKEDLSEDYAAEIISGLPKNVSGVLITYLDNADEIHAFSLKLGIRIVQIHGKIVVSELQKLKHMYPKLKIIKSLIVKNNNIKHLENEIELFSEYVNYFITDTFDPQTGASGATGKTHDWKISKHIVDISTKPVIAAGGLNANNVYDAVKFIKPFGIDSHTGVENADGRKSTEKLKMFVSKARKAFNEINSLIR